MSFTQYAPPEFRMRNASPKLLPKNTLIKTLGLPKAKLQQFVEVGCDDIGF